MLVEIPDPEIILSIILAFVGGLFALYVFCKIKPIMNKNNDLGSSNLARLEYYERQLIDMKIKLDSMDMSGLGTNQVLENELSRDSRKVIQNNPPYITPSKIQTKQTRAPNMDYNNITNRVLELITERDMTSRDIQTALGRSREHIARLMNKLFKEGFVERNTKTKPYTYSITSQGKTKFVGFKTAPSTA